MDRFLCVNLAQFMRSLSFGYFSKGFFLLIELFMKDLKMMTLQLVEGPWFHHGGFGLCRSQWVKNNLCNMYVIQI